MVFNALKMIDSETIRDGAVPYVSLAIERKNNFIITIKERLFNADVKANACQDVTPGTFSSPCIIIYKIINNYI